MSALKRRQISLVKLRPKHFRFFDKWWNDPELRKLTSESKEVVTSDQVDKIMSRHLANKDGFDFIILVNQKPVGHLLIQRKKNKKNYELYVAIGEKKYWEKGIGAIVITRACRWFFRKFPKEKIITLEVLTSNLRAIRCYEKVGFKKVRKTSWNRAPARRSPTWLMVKNK